MKVAIILAYSTVIIEERCSCKYQAAHLVVKKLDETCKIPLQDINCIVVDTLMASMSAYLLSELAKRDIPVIFTDDKHHPVGQFLPLMGYQAMLKRYKEQSQWSPVAKKQVWKRIVHDKLAQQQELLLKHGLEGQAAYLEQNLKNLRSGDASNREAVAARVYFEALFGQGFVRHQGSEIDISLDFGYAVLRSYIANQLAAHGYLQFLGIHHHSESNNFNLACDLMEPFRPVVDGLVKDEFAGAFDVELRRKLVGLLSLKVQYRDCIYRLRNVINGYISDCAAALNKEIDPSQIKGFSLL